MSDFMELAGMPAEKAFNTTVGLSGLMVVGNMAGWFFVEKFGRRGTAMYGTIILCLALYMIGILACINKNGAIWGQVVFMAIWSFCESSPRCQSRKVTDWLCQSIRQPSALSHGQSVQRRQPHVFVPLPSRSQP